MKRKIYNAVNSKIIVLGVTQATINHGGIKNEIMDNECGEVMTISHSSRCQDRIHAHTLDEWRTKELSRE